MLTNLSDISNYNNLDDYLPIFVGSFAIYAISIIILIIKKKIANNEEKNTEDDYFIEPRKFKLESVVEDILIYIMSLFRIRFIYTTFINNLPKLITYSSIFKYFMFLENYNLIYFIIFGGIIQILNDILLEHFNLTPTNNKLLVNKEGLQIKNVNKKIKTIFTNVFMIILTILISSYLGTLQTHTNINIFINLIYILPYLIHYVD